MQVSQLIQKNNYLPLFIFATAMGFLESIVVVYIRELYYPEGFLFPIKELPAPIIQIEWAREISTLLMLASVAWISGKIFIKRWSVFLFVFGIWDIMYYIGLKIFLNWPESFFTWDVLFLIPITWIGPVLAPVLCSLLMIATALIFDFLMMNYNLEKLVFREWIILISGAAFIYYTYTADFGMILLKGGFLKNFANLPYNNDFLKILTNWIPSKFNWEIFALGIALIVLAIGLVVKRSKTN